mmetsp:Transcript_32626/g.87598  ORF Transcript_32626/g.87598 Transcript_32626/m.87598 type:complete len:214 (+) Transcript_32626:133-774(+)
MSLVADASLDVHARGNDRVIQHTAHSAHSDLRWATVAAEAILRLPVNATECILILTIELLEADVALLTPFPAPRVLNEPVASRTVPAPPLGQHRVIEHRIPVTSVEHTAVVVKPRATVHGHHHGTLLCECTHQRCRLIARQLRKSRHEDTARSGRSIAQAGAPRVREVRLCGNAVVAHVGIGELPCCAITSTTATAVLRIRHAIHKSLRGDCC